MLQHERQQKVSARARAATTERSNKALKLTANRAAFIRELEWLMNYVRGSLSPALDTLRVRREVRLV